MPGEPQDTGQEPSLRPGEPGYTPPPGQWPCQTEVPGGAAMMRALPPRLLAFMYILLRDGLPAPGDVEQAALHVTDGTRSAFTNPHLERYAAALTVFLMYRPDGLVSTIMQNRTAAAGGPDLNALVGETDPRVWARHFVATFQRDDRLVVDESTLVGWFANAIQSGEDAYRNREERG